MHDKRNLRELQKIAEQYGFKYAGKTANMHYKWTRDDLTVVTVSQLGQWRSLANTHRNFKSAIARREELKARRRAEAEAQNNQLTR